MRLLTAGDARARFIYKPKAHHNRAVKSYTCKMILELPLSKTKNYGIMMCGMFKFSFSKSYKVRLTYLRMNHSWCAGVAALSNRVFYQFCFLTQYF